MVSSRIFRLGGGREVHHSGGDRPRHRDRGRGQHGADAGGRRVIVEGGKALVPHAEGLRATAHGRSHRRSPPGLYGEEARGDRGGGLDVDRGGQVTRRV